MRIRAAGAVLGGVLPLVVSACLPAEIGGRPPSFHAFLRRNGLEFSTDVMPDAARAANVAATVRREGPYPGSAIDQPVRGTLGCPIRCAAVLSGPGDTQEMWFVSYPDTRYGAGDMAWVLADPSGVWVASTPDNP